MKWKLGPSARDDLNVECVTGTKACDRPKEACVVIGDPPPPISIRQQRVNNEVMTAPEGLNEDINQRHALENCHSFLICQLHQSNDISLFDHRKSHGTSEDVDRSDQGRSSGG